jgi:hypothetical protein
LTKERLLQAKDNLDVTEMNESDRYDASSTPFDTENNPESQMKFMFQ